MKKYAKMTRGGGGVAQVYDGSRDIVIGKVRHPAAILERWSAEELAALGIVPVTVDPPPAIDETAQALEPVTAKKGDAEPRDRWRVVDLDPAEHLARVRAIRRGKYPEIGDQLDAILAQIQAMAASGTALEPEMTAIIAAVAQVKADWPLPSEAPPGAEEGLPTP